MKKEISFEEFVALGNDLKDLEKRIFALIEKSKRLPKRIIKYLFRVERTMLKFRIEARNEMMKSYSEDPKCQRCGLDIFEGPDRRVRPTGEIYNIKENQDS